jgi:hypothetical protein
MPRNPGLSLDALESKLPAGDPFPLAEGRTGDALGNLASASGPEPELKVEKLLGWLCTKSGGFGLGGAWTGRLPAPITCSSSRWSNPESSGTLPLVYLP